jgi:four helix bundle protein
MRNFREYDVWVDGMDLVDAIYTLVDTFPNTEKFGLSSQITRSAISIPSNIAEGASRTSQKDFARFLEISLGSCFELETQLRIAKKRMYSSQSNYEDLLGSLISLQKRIYKLRKKVLT